MVVSNRDLNNKVNLISHIKPEFPVSPIDCVLADEICGGVVWCTTRGYKSYIPVRFNSNDVLLK